MAPTHRTEGVLAPPTRAVFLDALGTLVDLEAPWLHPHGPLESLPPERLKRGFRAEMAYYREHSHEGRDPASLRALRERCAGVLSEALGVEVGVEAMMASIRFRAYPDAAPALESLGGRGISLVCVSNWDCSLGDVLEDVGLKGFLNGVVSSAVAGARKPDPAIFKRPLELAGCSPQEALHVGDTAEEDVRGARRAGIPALLLDREGAGDIASLGEIKEHLRP